MLEGNMLPSQCCGSAWVWWKENIQVCGAAVLGCQCCCEQEAPPGSALGPCLSPQPCPLHSLAPTIRKGQWLELEESSRWNYDTFVWWWFVCGVCFFFLIKCLTLTHTSSHQEHQPELCFQVESSPKFPGCHPHRAAALSGLIELAQGHFSSPPITAQQTLASAQTFWGWGNGLCAAGNAGLCSLLGLQRWIPGKSQACDVRPSPGGQ